MNKQMLMIAAAVSSFVYGYQALAAVISIVDYQSSKIHANTRIDTADQAESNLNCARFGMLGLEDPELWKYDCTKTKVSDTLSCYENCQCKSSVFKYNTANCNYNSQPGGNECNGNYDQCKAVSCPSGSDFNTTCDSLKYQQVVADIVNGRNCYRCDPLACPAGSSVETSSCANGYSLKAVGYSGEEICRSCASQNCEEGGYFASAPAGRLCSSIRFGDNICQKCCAAPITCDYGCSKYDTANGSSCQNVCIECNGCTPNDCSAFLLDSIPANAVYESCTIGCGNDVPHYRITGCKANYYNADNYWCGGELRQLLEADCAALGYTKTTVQCQGYDILYCPGDLTKASCPDAAI